MRALLTSAVLAAFFVSLVATRALFSSYLSGWIVDLPNERSLHSQPKPRTGGLALLIGISVSWVLFAAGSNLSLMAITGALAALCLIEDARGLSLIARLIAQIVAAAVFFMFTGPYPQLLLLPLVLGLAWSMNLYNFMDGSDGLAGGMAVIGFTAYAIAASGAGAPDLALLSAIVAAAAAGFLVWNFQPAKIFLGDTGSVPLGFLAAAIGVLGWKQGVWPFWFPGLVFSVFIIDATLTLAKRVITRQAFWRPHREHYYQRVIRMGWSHARLAVAVYALLLGTSISALLLRTARPGVVVISLLAWAGIFSAIARRIDRLWASSDPQRGLAQPKDL